MLSHTQPAALDVPLSVRTSGGDRPTHQRGTQPQAYRCRLVRRRFSRSANTKFGKSRLIPLHASSLKSSPITAIAGIVCSQAGRPLTSFLSPAVVDGSMKAKSVAPFTRFPGRLASAVSPPAADPRLHDFRHRFAVQTLLHWHRNGEDVRPALTHPVHLSRSRTCHRHLLVRDRHAGTDGGGWRAAGEALGGSWMKDTTSFPALVGVVLHETSDRPA